MNEHILKIAVHISEIRIKLYRLQFETGHEAAYDAMKELEKIVDELEEIVSSDCRLNTSQ